MDSKKLGNLGEKIAADYLKKKGYQILEKNYTSKFRTGRGRGEIDIVAKKEGIITFIEVKSLSSDGGIQPEEKVNYQKRKKIIKTANFWLMGKKIPLDVKWKIDVISLRMDLKNNKIKLRHFQNAVF
jgi:putative endonuclease